MQYISEKIFYLNVMMKQQINNVRVNYGFLWILFVKGIVAK